MSYTTSINGLNFIHNGDYSGNVIIIPDTDSKPIKVSNKGIEIPISLLQSFIISKLKAEYIAELESMNDGQFIKHLSISQT